MATEELENEIERLNDEELPDEDNEWDSSDGDKTDSKY